VTLDADVADAVKALMRDRDIGFKQALNGLVRQALRPQAKRAFRTPTFDMGKATIPMDKAVAQAAALEDEEAIAKLVTGR